MIYLDNAATTPIHPTVLDAMQPYLTEHFGNPSSLHAFGRHARTGVDTARKQLADFLHCRPDELIFTSGGTESIHSALFGTLLPGTMGKHVVTTSEEHHAVLHTCDYLREFGVDVTYVAPLKDGSVRTEDVLAAIRPDTLLVSVMTVNNELGSINPVKYIAEAVKAAHPSILVHSDMVQALGTLRVDLASCKVDIASFSAHKVHGPKGVGALFVRRGTPWNPVLHGGSQERARRAGTENVASIVGFGAAVQRLAEHWDAHADHLRAVRDAFWHSIRDIPDIHRNSPENAVPSILNIAFSGVRNDTLLMRLDLEGVAASAGSACTAGSLEPSHVLAACGFDDASLQSSIRFSFSETNSVEEAERASGIVRRVVQQLRGRA